MRLHFSGYRHEAGRADAVGLGLAVGLSRPYLGVHYPVDTPAGWPEGLGWALVGAWLVGRWDDLTQAPGVPAPAA
jgi:membrane-associated phospholipid phosphatase